MGCSASTEQAAAAAPSPSLRLIPTGSAANFLLPDRSSAYGGGSNNHHRDGAGGTMSLVSASSSSGGGGGGGATASSTPVLTTEASTVSIPPIDPLVVVFQRLTEPSEGDSVSIKHLKERLRGSHEARPFSTFYSVGKKPVLKGQGQRSKTYRATTVVASAPHLPAAGSSVAVRQFIPEVDVQSLAKEICNIDLLFTRWTSTTDAEPPTTPGSPSASPDSLGIARVFDVYLDLDPQRGLDLLTEQQDAVSAMLRNGTAPLRGWKVVSELCQGPELYDVIVDKGTLDEDEGREVMSQMLRTISFLHQHNVLHRDIKPEVLVFKSSVLFDASSNRQSHFSPLKFVSLRRCALISDDQPQQQSHSVIGTAYYIAPEILQGFRHTKASDIWSCGVVMYVLLTGTPPFSGTSDHDVFLAVKRGEVPTHTSEWHALSEEAKSLIHQMLNRNGSARPSAVDALQHAWFQKCEKSVE